MGAAASRLAADRPAEPGRRHLGARVAGVRPVQGRARPGSDDRLAQAAGFHPPPHAQGNRRGQGRRQRPAEGSGRRTPPA